MAGFLGQRVVGRLGVLAVLALRGARQGCHRQGRRVLVCEGKEWLQAGVEQHILTEGEEGDRKEGW